jgi:LCP family protein required for cell wall assembly
MALMPASAPPAKAYGRAWLPIAALALGWALLAGCRPAFQAAPAQAHAGPLERPAETAEATRVLPVIIWATEQPPKAPPEKAPAEAPSPGASPTPAAQATETPFPWQEYPPPSTPPATAVPPPVPAFELPPGVEVVALLGTDTEAPRVGRTDTLMLLFFDRESGLASLVSIPRDLYVYQPGWSMDRINTAYLRGGFDLLAFTLEYNLGVRPGHWVLVHLGDFSRFIDELGGIPMPVSVPLPGDCGGIPEGIVNMDGATALCYLRERRTSSDIERSRRQQEALPVILRRVLSIDGLSRLPEWYDRYVGAVETSFTLDDLLALIPTVLKVQDSSLHHFQIGWNEVESWGVPGTGARVFLPEREAVLAILKQAIDALAAPPPTPLETGAPPAGTDLPAP